MADTQKQFAAMTGDELYAQIRAMEGAFTLDFTPLTALRDAIRAEAYADASDEYTRRLVDAQGRAERAEQEAERLLLKWTRTESARATAESALGEARREGAREALTKLADWCEEGRMSQTNTPMQEFVADANDTRKFRDREYPTTPSREGVKVWSCAKCNEMGKVWDGCAIAECGAKIPDGIPRTNLTPATPQPSEPLVIRADEPFGYVRITITAEDARRLLALAQTTTEGC